MSHGCFISYKKEDKKYLDLLSSELKRFGIPYAYLDKTIDSDNIDTVISVLRQNYMHNKPVTLFLIGKNSYEDTEEKWQNTYGYFIKHPEYNEQSFIIRELRATLSDYDGNPRHGVVGIVLPEVENEIYGGTAICPHCNAKYNIVNINDDTVIREFSANYYLVPDKGCRNHYPESGRYCLLCKLDEFLENPKLYIDEAYEKSKSELSNIVHYRDIMHDYKLRDE